MIGIAEKKTPSRYQVLNRANTAPGSQDAASSEPVIYEFTAIAEITIEHGFPTKYVSIDIFTTTGFPFPQEKIRAIQCSDNSVRIAFHGAQSGVAKLRY